VRMTSKLTHRPVAVLSIAPLVVLLALLLAPASGAATVKASSKGLVASMKVGTHHPTVGRKWPLEFTATLAGKPAKVTVTYEYLYDGKVVAVRSHHAFTGHFTDTLIFPSSALHEPLTFRAVIASGATTVNLNYAIEVT
jgi:hypothetical protein